MCNCILFLWEAECKVKEPNDSYLVWNPCCVARMKTAVTNKQVLHKTDDASSIAAVMLLALKTNVAPQ
jgi:hypothetical protein